jgi:hypothetical protein
MEPVRSFVELLNQKSEELGDKPLFTFLVTGEIDGETEVLTFAGLRQHAHEIAPSFSKRARAMSGRFFSTDAIQWT